MFFDAEVSSNVSVSRKRYEILTVTEPVLGEVVEVVRLGSGPLQALAAGIHHGQGVVVVDPSCCLDPANLGA